MIASLTMTSARPTIPMKQPPFKAANFSLCEYEIEKGTPTSTTDGLQKPSYAEYTEEKVSVM